MSIQGTVGLANANDAVLEDTRDEQVEIYDIKNETLKFQHEKAEKIREDAQDNAILGALGAIGKGIASIF